MGENLPEKYTILSIFLGREVIVDFYFSSDAKSSAITDLLLINDGQDLIPMDFGKILKELDVENKITSLLCAGIHSGIDRKKEYGTAGILNYKGQGEKAALYTRFVLEELVPFIQKQFALPASAKRSFCGFSLGGLSAFDIVWNHPNQFSNVGVFSGSFWWRSVSQDSPEFVEDQHRIMHYEIRNGNYYPWLKFFFEAGELDETADRNHNGIIDSIDDTISLIKELESKGYDRKKNIYYLQLKDGKHDVSTWGRAFPAFLKWCFSKMQL